MGLPLESLEQAGEKVSPPAYLSSLSAVQRGGDDR